MNTDTCPTCGSPVIVNQSNEGTGSYTSMPDFEFSKWVSSCDWVWLPSKGMWYNEEDEDNITPTTTEELYKLFKQQSNGQ